MFIMLFICPGNGGDIMGGGGGTLNALEALF